MSKKILKPIILLMLITVFPLMTFANTTYTFYNVEGENIEAITQSIQKNRPNDNNSGNEWHISWQFAFVEKNNACYLSKPKVNKKVIVILPKWIENKKVSLATKKEWERYINSVKTHQLGHVAFATKAQAAIKRALEHMPPEKKCAQLKIKANALAMEILNDFYKQDRAYEKSTQK